MGEADMTRAQDRGASLLLRLIVQLRKGVVAFEESLAESRRTNAEPAGEAEARSAA